MTSVLLLEDWIGELIDRGWRLVSAVGSRYVLADPTGVEHELMRLGNPPTADYR